MGNYSGEEYGKRFKAKLKVSEEELEKYLESWDRGEVLLLFSFFKSYGTENEYVILCIKYVIDAMIRRMIRLIYAPTEMIYWIWHTTREKKENYFATTLTRV